MASSAADHAQEHHMDMDMDMDNSAVDQIQAQQAPIESLHEEEAAEFDSDGDEIHYSDSDLDDPEAHIPLNEEETIAEHESILNKITLDAETVIASQPRATQIELTVRTRALFKDYKHHGSMARLKVGLDKYFREDRADKELRFQWPEKDNNNNPYTEPGSATGTTTTTANYLTGPFNGKTRPLHFGQSFKINHTSSDDDNGYSSYSQIPCPADKIDNPLFPDLQPHTHPLRVIDPEMIPYVTTLPWNPVTTTIAWDPRALRWPMGLLGKINSIVSVVDLECRARLFHHVCRYGPSPVFRTGITEQIRTHWSTIFQSATQHYLGMTPQTRSFLRSVYETQTYLNRAERRLLALACRVAEDSVDLFWEDLNESRRGYVAMKVFIMARECERAVEAREAEKVRRHRKLYQLH
ncbi:hypothetical protein ABEF93_000569 [Exophiala dermatitidis]